MDSFTPHLLLFAYHLQEHILKKIYLTSNYLQKVVTLLLIQTKRVPNFKKYLKSLTVYTTKNIFRKLVT